jgi:hypothetical protein
LNTNYATRQWAANIDITKQIVYIEIMTKRIILCGFFLIIFSFYQFSQEEYLKITTNVSPRTILQGEEGILKIKITPKNGIKISSHPEFMIKLESNSDITFPKIFFTASELNFQTKQENETIILDLEKEIEIPLKVNENSLIGKHKINGEVIFTAVSKDHWSLKTYQKFITDFFSKKNQKKKKN